MRGLGFRVDGLGVRVQVRVWEFRVQGSRPEKNSGGSRRYCNVRLGFMACWVWGLPFRV